MFLMRSVNWTTSVKVLSVFGLPVTDLCLLRLRWKEFYELGMKGMPLEVTTGLRFLNF